MNNNSSNKQEKKEIKSNDFNRDENSYNKNIDNESKRLEKYKDIMTDEVNYADYPAW